MRFEKWQALGNDYVIVEAAALGLSRPRASFGPCATGTWASAPTACSCSRRPTSPASSRGCGSSTPTAPRPSVSGNGAREAILYLRRAGWTDAAQFSIQTAAGEIRPTILSETTCRVDMGRARLGHAGELAGFRFQHVTIGNPQTAIRVASEAELAALDLPAIGPAIEHDPQFPNRTNVSWYAELAADRIRARIFERGVGETASSGTGACGAAIAHVLRGGDAPVTVVLDGGELEVDVGEDLHVDLTGWAVPVYAGEASAELLAAARSQ